MLDAAWLVILGMLLLGKLCQFAQVFEHQTAAQVLNRYVIYAALPPLVISTLQSLQFNTMLLWMVLLPWLMMIVSVSLMFVIGRVLHWSKAVTGAMMMLTALGNTSFLGFPIVTALLGSEALPAAMFYDQFGSFLMLSSVGLLIAAHYGHTDEVSLRSITLSIIKFPPFIALIIGLLPIPWHENLLTAMSQMGASLVPVACFAVGLQWRWRLQRRHWLPLSIGLGTKMILLPLLAGVVMYFAQVPNNIAQVGLLEAGMPPMITAGAIASAAGLDRDLASAMVGFGVVLALFSLPLLNNLAWFS